MSVLTQFGPSTGLVDALPGAKAPVLIDWSLRFQTPALKCVFDLWREAAGQKRWPSREAFTMRILLPVIAQAAILDVLCDAERRRYKVRLMGTGLDQYLLPMTGRYIDEAVPPYFVERWQKLLGLAVDEAQPVRYCSRTEFRDQLSTICEGLMMPLSCDGKAVTGLLLAIFHYPSASNSQEVRALYESIACELSTLPDNV